MVRCNHGWRQQQQRQRHPFAARFAPAAAGERRSPPPPPPRALRYHARCPYPRRLPFIKWLACAVPGVEHCHLECHAGGCYKSASHWQLAWRPCRGQPRHGHFAQRRLGCARRCARHQWHLQHCPLPQQRGYCQPHLPAHLLVCAPRLVAAQRGKRGGRRCLFIHPHFCALRGEAAGFTARRGAQARCSQGCCRAPTRASHLHPPRHCRGAV